MEEAPVVTSVSAIVSLGSTLNFAENMHSLSLKSRWPHITELLWELSEPHIHVSCSSALPLVARLLTVSIPLCLLEPVFTDRVVLLAVECN